MSQQGIELAERIRETLRADFFRQAEMAGCCMLYEAEKCFDTLATSLGAVSPELLLAADELFDDIEVGKVAVGLMRSIHQGWWSPASATEYIQRFIAMVSGTIPFRFEETEGRP